MMEVLAIAIRAVHFAALMALAGELAFFLAVAGPVARMAGDALPDGGGAFRLRVIRVALAWLLIATVSGAIWFVAQAAAMSGLPLARAVNGETLQAVLAQTFFGHVWLARCAVAAAMLVLLLALECRMVARRAALVACALLAAGLLASLVLVGHATAEKGTARLLHQCADAMHLLAAAMWLGTLVPLAVLLVWARRKVGAPGVDLTAGALRRFSLLAMISVGAILATGIANSWYTVGSVPALLGTQYGHLLLAKLGLVAAMIALAAFNRVRLTPRTAHANTVVRRKRAFNALSRNARAEALLGVGVLALAGSLGAAVPALHARAVWPLPFTFDWNAKAFVAAYPTTYLAPPTGYTAESIARGNDLYAQHCAGCHGSTGQGDGPVAAHGSDIAPPDLRTHFHFHRQGDLLWWIEHGIAGTGMPAFGARISRAQTWDIVNALHAKADALLVDSLGDWAVASAITAPDFTFQVAGLAEERISELHGRNDVLLFFYTPESIGQLRALTACSSALERAKLRVIALPLHAAADANMLRGIEPHWLGHPAPAVAAAYAAFGMTLQQPSQAGGSMAFLVDPQGRLRARWTHGEEVSCAHLFDMAQETSRLGNVRPPAAMRMAHAH